MNSTPDLAILAQSRNLLGVAPDEADAYDQKGWLRTRQNGLAMEQLRITVTQFDGAPSLELSGSVDVQSKELLRSHLHDLLAEGHTRIRVDLAGVEYLGSVGLAVLIEVSKRLRKKGGQLLLAPGPKALRRHLALLNLEQVLDFQEPLE